MKRCKCGNMEFKANRIVKTYETVIVDEDQNYLRDANDLNQRREERIESPFVCTRCGAKYTSNDFRKLVHYDEERDLSMKVLHAKYDNNDYTIYEFGTDDIQQFSIEGKTLPMRRLGDYTFDERDLIVGEGGYLVEVSRIDQDNFYCDGIWLWMGNRPWSSSEYIHIEEEIIYIKKILKEVGIDLKVKDWVAKSGAMNVIEIIKGSTQYNSTFLKLDRSRLEIKHIYNDIQR